MKKLLGHQSQIKLPLNKKILQLFNNEEGMKPGEWQDVQVLYKFTKFRYEWFSGNAGKRFPC